MRNVLFRISARTSIIPKRPFHFFWKKSRFFRREAFLVWSNRSRPKIHNVLFRVLARTSILSKKTFRKSEKFTNFRREAFVPFGLENDMILIMMHFQNDKKIKKSNIRSSRPFAGCGREGCEHKLTFCVVFYTQRNYCAHFIISRESRSATFASRSTL